MEPVVSLAKPPVDWREIVKPLEPFLQAVSKRMGEQIGGFEPGLASYAAYALNAQGKQLRPALVGLSAAATGKIQDSHVTVAVIIEMVHLATLVHDDVVDEATIRRGRLTLAANWENQKSVLLGDCLFAKALTLAAGFPTTEICRAVSSASFNVCQGEILQDFRPLNSAPTRAEYLRVLALKTGELFALACDMGAFLGGAPGREREAMRGFGLALGTAYQIYDDCLDLFGTEGKAGKSLGTDLAKGKVTLPMLVVLESAVPGAQAELGRLLAAYRPEQFSTVVSLLKEQGALDESLKVIHSFLDEARENVRTLGESVARNSLLNLCDVLAAQTESLGGAA